MLRNKLIFSSILAITACRPGQPCPTCDDEADDLPTDLPADNPDLPCGGADLQADDDNCGECGNACLVQGVGAYSAGGCVDGACGPTWHGTAWPEQTTLTCAEVCAASAELPCQTGACADLTGLVCESVANSPCGVISGGDTSTLVDFGGGCGDPIPWPEQTEFGGSRVVYCCCG